MYNYKDIKSYNQKLLQTYKVSCEPKKIARRSLLDSLYPEEITLDIFKSGFRRLRKTQLEHVYMCGNLGDPMIAKDTLKIFRYM